MHIYVCIYKTNIVAYKKRYLLIMFVCMVFVVYHELF